MMSVKVILWLNKNWQNTLKQFRDGRGYGNCPI